MNEFLSSLSTAYATGIACSAGTVKLVKLLPIPDYAIKMLCFVLPIPPTAIALVMLYYGPSDAAASVGTEDHRAIVVIFWLGVAAAPLSAVILIIGKVVIRKLKQRFSRHLGTFETTNQRLNRYELDVRR